MNVNSHLSDIFLIHLIIMKKDLLERRDSRKYSIARTS